MEWVSLIVAGVALLLVAAPVVLLLGTFLVLVPMALLAPSTPMLARSSFECPFSKRRVTAAFLTRAGEAAPADVVSCSMFTDGVRCGKGCLGLAHASERPSLAMARYALLADGEAMRDAA